MTINSFKNYLKTSPKPYFLLVVLFAFGLSELFFTIFYKFLAIYDNEISFERFYALAFLIYIGYFIVRIA